jgi:mRNA interferase RelE/StbE
VRVHRIAIAPSAVAAIRALHPDIKRAVRNALTALASDPERGLALQGELAGLHRYKVRRYRIIYEIVRPTRIVRVVAVGHRSRLYEDLADARRG